MRRLVVPLSIVAVGLVGLAGPGLLADSRAQEATPTASGHPLVGSWEVVFAFEDGAGFQLSSLVTYTADGNVLVANAGQLPGLPPASGLFFTEGHGAWTATGERTADASFRFLVLDQTGGLAGTSIARMAIEIDPSGDGHAGSFTLDTVTPAGNSMGAGRGTLRATRIGVEPLGTPVGTPAATPLA